MFAGLASEYEEDIEHRDNYSRLIIEKCTDLLTQQGGPRVRLFGQMLG